MVKSPTNNIFFNLQRTFQISRVISKYFNLQEFRIPKKGRTFTGSLPVRTSVLAKMGKVGEEFYIIQRRVKSPSPTSDK